MAERKIIQVSVSDSADSYLIVSLCDDGSLWRYEFEHSIPDISDPQLKRKKKIPAKWTKLASIPSSESTTMMLDEIDLENTYNHDLACSYAEDAE